MSEEIQEKKQINKLKVYGAAVLIYLIINGLVFELFIEFLENHYSTHLFPMFPYTRIALLIITILIAKNYIDKRSPGKTKKAKLSLRLIKYTCLVIIFFSLFIGAFFSVMTYEEPKPPIVIPKLQQPELYQIKR
jgi:hypothetical protein